MNDNRNDRWYEDSGRGRQNPGAYQQNTQYQQNRQYQQYQEPYRQYPPQGGREAPGKSEATTSMILGIASIVLLCFGFTAIGSIVLGIIGLVYASRAKRLGFSGSARTAGFTCSLIGLIGGCVVIVALVLFGAAFLAAFTGAVGHYGYYY